MTDKLRLNKNALREQNERLKMLLEYLPTLTLRKQQLQAAVGRVREQQRRCRQEQRALREQVEPWVGMLAAAANQGLAQAYAEVERVQTEPVNIAGIVVPRLEDVVFVPGRPPLLTTPLIFDDVVEVLRRAARLRAQAQVLAQQHDRLAQELARVSQRINLYEKVLVPKTRHNIRRLRVYLGDQRTAAVCRAKLAKAKVVARRAEQVMGGAYGDR